MLWNPCASMRPNCHVLQNLWPRRRKELHYAGRYRLAHVSLQTNLKFGKLTTVWRFPDDAVSPTRITLTIFPVTRCHSHSMHALHTHPFVLLPDTTLRKILAKRGPPVREKCIYKCVQAVEVIFLLVVFTRYDFPRVTTQGERRPSNITDHGHQKKFRLEQQDEACSTQHATGPFCLLGIESW